jgi:hypothetical protein
MGDSNYGGNGSIHWSIDHQDGKSLTIKRNTGARPTQAGRSSVHANKCKLQGRDPRNDVNHFEVTLRFEPNQDGPDPIQQLQDALKEAQARSAEPYFFVKFLVPATVDKKQRKRPGQKPWPDVRVQW